MKIINDSDLIKSLNNFKQKPFDYCIIDNSLISAIIDNNKLKQGFYTPGTNIPIVNINSGLKLKPNIIVILAWNFKKEILSKNKKLIDTGVKFYFPIDLS